MIEGNIPGSQFNNIPNSIYWAIVTMTTVGYGDITPATGLGKFLSACVMLIGYTIIAVPTGIVSASMMKDYKRRRDKECPNCHRSGHEDNAKFCKYCGHDLNPDLGFRSTSSEYPFKQENKDTSCPIADDIFPIERRSQNNS